MSQAEFSVAFESELEMQRWVAANAASFKTGLICYLEGDLGAGKTSFSRALLQALGYQGRVKSPTYTLLEVYDLAGFIACHFDLYRLGNAEELSYLGAEDYDDGSSLWLVEWPQRGAGYLPQADIEISITQAGERRRYCFVSCTDKGQNTLQGLHR